MNQTLRIVTGELDPYLERSQKMVRFVCFVMDQNNALVSGATTTLTLADTLGHSSVLTPGTAGSGALGTTLTPLGAYYVDADLSTGGLQQATQITGVWTASSGATLATASFAMQIIDNLSTTY